ncbi:MAG: Segregation and condensation protein A [Chlamydiales bacterium]|nr:Segregation and condensation protein A [Chlamydiales bacterium]MCH9619300.1 Segregation and condensation protein A [Chlamydiales bacterium]MCH9622562.1 Segregation and condensation protein A [Chlamydiales bacterium]
METLSFSLSQFKGPLDLLIYLIQKEEIDVLEIPIHELTIQFVEKELEQIDLRADTLSLAASLLLMKSRKLLPEESGEAEDEVNDRMEMIEQLIEYCRLKEAAKSLSQREESQSRLFPRNPPDHPKVVGSGLEDVTLEHLASQLSGIMEKVAKREGTLEDDAWHVSPKIEWLCKRIEREKEIDFETLFYELSCRSEIIVTFLALLELMKGGKIHICKEEGNLCLRSTS